MKYYVVVQVGEHHRLPDVRLFTDLEKAKQAVLEIGVWDDCGDCEDCLEEIYDGWATEDHEGYGISLQEIEVSK